MIGHLGRVPLEMRQALVLLGGRERVEITLQGTLRVDDDVLPPRQAHDQVGTQTAILRVPRFLLAEIAPVHHASHLHHLAELDLTPAAAHLRGPQGLHQIRGLGLQLLVGSRHVPHLLPEPLVGAHALPLDLPDLLVHGLQGFGERLDKVSDRLLLRAEIGFRRLLELLEILLGQL